MANPNMAMRNMPKMPMWEVHGWKIHDYMTGKRNDEGHAPTDAAEEFADKIRAMGIKGVRITGRKHNRTKHWSVMVPGNYVSDAGKMKDKVTVDHIVVPK